MSAPQTSFHGEAPTPSRRTRLAGFALSALPVFSMALNSIQKVMHTASMVTFMTRFGVPENQIFKIGVVELACVIIYLIPQTSVLGAILMAAYMGGATATVIRAGHPGFGPVVLGVFTWLGLYLREPRLRALIPLRK
jgi:hypothetical protein